MINYHKQLVSALKTVLPTHYEMALTSKTQTPCISYMELNNYQLTEPINSTVGYSRITYQIKVWGNDLNVIQENALKVDKALRTIGFKRISSGELYDNNSTMIQKILTYEALGFEEFN
jgi:hypothetical protein